EPLLVARIDRAVLGAEVDVERDRALDVVAMRVALALEIGLARSELLLRAAQPLLERFGVRLGFTRLLLSLARLLLGLHARHALVMEPIAEPAAHRGANDEADGAAGQRTDRGAAAHADRLLLVGMRLRIFALVTGPARLREQRADGQDDDLLSHGSLLEA